MFERTTNTDLVVATILWATVVSLYAVAGLVLLGGRPYGALLIAEVACGVSAFAAVRHIRCYAVRVCELVRHVDARIESRAGAEVPLQRIH